MSAFQPDLVFTENTCEYFGRKAHFIHITLCIGKRIFLLKRAFSLTGYQLGKRYTPEISLHPELFVWLPRAPE